jgi:hypothetical protein
MLADMLYRVNPYFGVYQTAHEQRLALENGPTPIDLLFMEEIKLIRGGFRYPSLPDVNEPALIDNPQSNL